MHNLDAANATLTTQQVADRLGISTAELSELRLKDIGLPIERDGFKLFYRLDAVRAFEQHEALAVFERVLACDHPLVVLRRMAQASGLTKLTIAGQPIDVNVVEKPVAPQPTRASQIEPNAQPRVLADSERPLDNSHPWFVVHTKPRQEQVALENLERQGYTCYLPTVKLRKPRGRKLTDCLEPMFARYLFVAIDPKFTGKGGASIRSTRGVHELVRFGKDPMPIAFDLLNAIFERERVQHRHPEQPFKPGERVTVVDGPLAGLDSIYQAQTGEERSMILLTLLNRPTQVKIATAQLRKTG